MLDSIFTEDDSFADTTTSEDFSNYITSSGSTLQFQQNQININENYHNTSYDNFEDDDDITYSNDDESSLILPQSTVNNTNNISLNVNNYKSPISNNSQNKQIDTYKLNSYNYNKKLIANKHKDPQTDVGELDSSKENNCSATEIKTNYSSTEIKENNSSSAEISEGFPWKRLMIWPFILIPMLVTDSQETTLVFRLGVCLIIVWMAGMIHPNLVIRFGLPKSRWAVCLIYLLSGMILSGIGS